jgi:hypothetical protein
MIQDGDCIYRHKYIFVINSESVNCRTEAGTHNESFAFSGTLRCAYDALRNSSLYDEVGSTRRSCATLWSFRVS